MRKKQKNYNPIIKLEQQSFDSDLQIGNFRQRKKQKSQSFQLAEKKSQNTLSLLTKNFITLIKSKQNMTIDSNDAARQLGIQKRRIYDITNVLEGIGYVQKVHKNKLRWLGGHKDPQVCSQIENLDSQILTFQRKQIQLTSKIQYLEKRIKNDFVQNKELNYIRIGYLKQIMQNLPSKPKKVILVKAQKDTAIISQLRPGTSYVDIQIAFNKQSKGQVYYISKNEQTQIQQDDFLKFQQSSIKQQIEQK